MKLFTEDFIGFYNFHSVYYKQQDTNLVYITNNFELCNTHVTEQLAFRFQLKTVFIQSTLH